MRIPRKLALAAAAAVCLGLGGFGIAQAATQGTGPYYAQGTVVDLCIGTAGTVVDKVYAEAGPDAGKLGTCGTDYTQLPETSDPDGYAIGQVASTADDVTVDSPGAQISDCAGGTVSLQLTATSSRAVIESWSAVGLPGGLAINDSGLISGTLPACAAANEGTFVVTVTATDSDNIAGSTSFDWTIES